jgi:hypothetical protein
MPSPPEVVFQLLDAKVLLTAQVGTSLHLSDNAGAFNRSKQHNLIDVLFKDGVERHSRFAMLIKVPSKDTEVVVAALYRPRPLCRMAGYSSK